MKALGAIEEHGPDILGMSALLTTTMPYMKVVIETMKEKGMRDDYIVLVGGAPAEGAQIFTAQRGRDADFQSSQLDFADTSSITKIVEQVYKQTGRLDILVNNAGVMQEALVEEMSLADWERTIPINLTTPFMLIKSALPHLRAVKGAIVNIGSIEVLGSNPRHAAYCASKAGLHGLTRAIAVVHGIDGVRCNAVAPGWIETDLNTKFVNSMPDPVCFRQDIGRIHPIAAPAGLMRLQH